MVALPGFNLTSDNDTVRTESINQYTIPGANAVRVYEAFTWMCPAVGLAHQWPAHTAVAITGTHTESDELSATSFATSSESVTGAEVAVRAFASDKLQSVASTLTPEQQVAVMVEEMRNRFDKDALATFVGATNASDNTGVNLSIALWETAFAAFKAQKPGLPRVCFVGSFNQLRDLRAALRSSGNGGLLMGAGLELYNGMTRMGYQGMWAGVEIYEGNTTQADADNDTGGFVAAAPMGVWTGAESLEQGGQYQMGGGIGMAVWRPLRAESIRIPSRIGTDYVASAMYGCAVTADHLVRAFISKKAAA